MPGEQSMGELVDLEEYRKNKSKERNLEQLISLKGELSAAIQAGLREINGMLITLNTHLTNNTMGGEQANRWSVVYKKLMDLNTFFQRAAEKIDGIGDSERSLKWNLSRRFLTKIHQAVVQVGELMDLAERPPRPNLQIVRSHSADATPNTSPKDEVDAEDD